MTQLALPFDHPGDANKMIHPPCHRIGCPNPAMPGRPMCRECAGLFSGAVRGKILKGMM